MNKQPYGSVVVNAGLQRSPTANVGCRIAEPQTWATRMGYLARKSRHCVRVNQPQTTASTV